MQNLSGGTRFKCYPGPFSSVSYMFPMWEMLGIAEKLQEYRNLVHDDSSGDQVMKEWTLKITASLDRLVSAAENEINSLIRQENEKENTDS